MPSEIEMKIDDFWDADETGEGASEEDIKSAEDTMGLRLPVELAALLKIQDGGNSRFVEFRKGDSAFPLLVLFGVSGKNDAGRLDEVYAGRVVDNVPTGVLVFAAMGHSWNGLDYRSTPEEPSVVFRTDDDSDIELVADCFADFLGGLVEE